jgi:hypothetical protein
VHINVYFLLEMPTLHIILIKVINIVALTITMSEEPINRNDDVQGDGRDAAEIVGDSLNEGVDKIKAGAKAVAKKIDDPDKDIGTEYNKEKLKEQAKDI